MISTLLCVMLRIAAPQLIEFREFVDGDPALRFGVHLNLSPAAMNYLRHETWTPAHPKAKEKR